VNQEALARWGLLPQKQNLVARLNTADLVSIVANSTEI
jgi:hypothetical protein